MKLSRVKKRLVLAAVITGLALLPAAKVRAEEPKLWVDPTADFSPAISDWPAEVVPIYPGAKPFECSPENQPKCSPNPGIYPNPPSGLEVSADYSLIVEGVSSREVRQWYDSQLLTNYWVLAQTETDQKVSSKYYKCWSPNGKVGVSISAQPMGKYPGAPILLVLKLEKTKKQPGTLRCGENVRDGFPGNNTSPSANSPMEMTRLCSLNGEPAKEASLLKSEMQAGFGVNVCESDLCGAEASTPWSTDGLKAMQTTLNLLNQSCFLQSAGLKSICKSGDQEKQACSGGSSAYASPADHKVVFCHDRWSVKDQKKIINKFYGDGNELLQQLLVHEIGHVYWRNPDGSLNFDKVSNWLLGAGYLDCTTMLGCLGVVGGGFATPPSDAPSEYAATGPAEDFAESVRFYVTQPNKLRGLSPLRYKYLRDNAFCGYEYGSK